MFQPIQLLFLAIVVGVGFAASLSPNAVLSLFLVIIFGWLGGQIFELGYGYKKKKGCLPKITIKPIF